MLHAKIKLLLSAKIALQNNKQPILFPTPSRFRWKETTSADPGPTRNRKSGAWTPTFINDLELAKQLRLKK